VQEGGEGDALIRCMYIHVYIYIYVYISNKSPYRGDALI